MKELPSWSLAYLCLLPPLPQPQPHLQELLSLVLLSQHPPQWALQLSQSDRKQTNMFTALFSLSSGCQ